QDDEGADDEPTPPAHSEFDFAPVNACDSPKGSVSYAEVGIEWGFTDPDVWRGEHAENGSVAVADFDHDGDLDVVMGFDGQPPVLYTRDADGFSPSDLPLEDGLTQIGMADLDNDGRLDLTFGGVVESVLLNRETGWEAVRFPAPPWEDETGIGAIRSIQPMDIDRDGNQDAYVLVSSADASGVAGMDFIAWGVGDGSFVADTTVVPEEWGYQKGFDIQWFDWDADGWQDVYVVNELDSIRSKSSSRPEGNFFLRNVEGELTLANDDCLCHMRHDGMGAGLGDFNGDARPDLVIAGTGRNPLLQQLEDGTYVDVGQATGADTLDGTIASMAWGAIFVDFDNDGLQDIAVAEGDLWHEHTPNPIVKDMAFNVVRQVDDSRFELANEHGFGQMGSWRTIVAADHNADGIVDFIVSDVEHRPMLLLSEGCTANNWVEVAAPHGSRVEVEVAGATRVGWANTASSFGGAVEPVARFGLGPIDTIDGVRVETPDGRIIEHTDAFAARRRISVSK
ncbi:MAG: CRTAC1 family protein, partial [Myxococcota bacterium]|nr:CRTAC1 family protein [Myxococcota bacterium]